MPLGFLFHAPGWRTWLCEHRHPIFPPYRTEGPIDGFSDRCAQLNPLTPGSLPDTATARQVSGDHAGTHKGHAPVARGAGVAPWVSGPDASIAILGLGCLSDALCTPGLSDPGVPVGAIGTGYAGVGVRLAVWNTPPTAVRHTSAVMGGGRDLPATGFSSVCPPAAAPPSVVIPIVLGTYAGRHSGGPANGKRPRAAVSPCSGRLQETVRRHPPLYLLPANCYGWPPDS